MEKTEFRAEDGRPSDRRGPIRWIMSKVARYAWLPAAALALSVLNNVAFSALQLFVGRGFGAVAEAASRGASADQLGRAVLPAAVALAVAAFVQGVSGIGRNLSFEFLAQRLERDARAELYASLLGKSATWHARNKIGDLMARATNDVHFLNLMFSPGVLFIMDAALTMFVPLIYIAAISPRLLLVPALFSLALALTLADYARRLEPIADAQRESFGAMNAKLEDAIEGIEVVKSNVAEASEKAGFLETAWRVRDLYVRQAMVQARYWPLLAFAVAWGLGFLHALSLWKRGLLPDLGAVVSAMLLWNGFRFATFMSVFTFQLLQMGLASARRVLATMNDESGIDENPGGRQGRIEGRIEFRDVGFSYGGESVLRNLSFVVEPGETVAVVGRTGSGKTSVLRLVNRIFDPDEGQVLVDGVDAREWSLEALRSQTAVIEQDVFLFSRPVAANIAFGREDASPSEIEAAARAAQAHGFVSALPKGYDEVVGERGTTLSGGQKQRVAIARALLADPRVLLLDDATSAIDAATEDEIRAAMDGARKGRTTFLVTHRLAQIRRADRILVLDRGELVAQGRHEELYETVPAYRRLFERTA